MPRIEAKPDFGPALRLTADEHSLTLMKRMPANHGTCAVFLFISDNLWLNCLCWDGWYHH